METFTQLKDFDNLSLVNEKPSLKFSAFLTKMGYSLLVAGTNGIVELFLPEENMLDIVNRMRKIYPYAKEEEDEILKQAKEKICEYFKGEKVDFFDIKVDLSRYKETSQHVFEIVRKIPYGETRTYKQISDELNLPKMSRAIGRILNSNRVPIIVPCHRVIKSDGEIGGYHNGLEWKIKLLKLENILK
jgi:methylated-DNA-[protein]-cysteine S-methyltransferase